jgi:hypothetical protein
MRHDISYDRAAKRATQTCPGCSCGTYPDEGCGAYKLEEVNNGRGMCGSFFRCGGWHPGTGPDDRFTLVARLASKVRAKQIVRLLNEDEVVNGVAIAAMIKEESDHSCTF